VLNLFLTKEFTQIATNMKPLKKNNSSIDKFLDSLELISPLLLFISFGSLLILTMGDFLLPGFVPNYEQFFLLPIGLLCPFGAFALLIQLIVISKRRPSNFLRERFKSHVASIFSIRRELARYTILSLDSVMCS
jgi:hypothetical protein